MGHVIWPFHKALNVFEELFKGSDHYKSSKLTHTF